MTAILTPAPDVKAVADALIPLHHRHLLEHRVRMEYVFSDAEIETNGKARWADARRIANLAAYLAGEPEGQAFEPLTYVCAWCRRWCTSEEYQEVQAGDDTFALCPRCGELVSAWDLTTNTSITRLTNGKNKAADKEAAGPPANPGFFVITVYQTYWGRMSEDTRRAVVDHELMHCAAVLDKYGDVKLSLRPHDLEEFSDIVERHGYAWRGTIRDFVCAARRHDAQSEFSFESEIPSEEGTDAN